MKAVILVGGEGTRLRPLTFHTPKPLLPIANVPFVERQISWLRQYGVTDVVLSLGYLPDAFEEYFHSNPPEGVRLDYAVEHEPMGTAGAIKYAAGDIDGDFIVCNGDVLTELDVEKLIATIALTQVDDPSSFGVVPIKNDGQVLAFVEKPPKESAPSHWINAGIYVLSQRFLDLIPEGMNVSIERETFPRLLQEGSMYAMQSDEYWIDIGTPEKYLQAHRDVISQKDWLMRGAELNEIRPGLFSNGEVVLGNNVQVLSPSLVGANSEIGDDCVLDGVCMGTRCVLENGVKMHNAVLMSGVKIEQGCEIKDSIVGEASDIAQESILEEFTLIGAHEKIEARTTLRAERIGSVV
jgi:NDP-sugar pyrophosphorylase family protein